MTTAMSPVVDGQGAATGEPPLVHPAALEVRGLHVAYGATLALENVGFTVPSGRTVAVLGANASGKTTLLRTIAGQLTPTAGTVVRQGACAIVPQGDRSRLDYPVSALDVALMGALPGLAWWRRAGRTERRCARAALTAVGMRDREHCLFGVLSGGQRQRVLVARALVARAPVLLLDEPLAGVDDLSARQLTNLFAQLAGDGKTLLIATHDLAHAGRCDLVLCLERRQLAFGAPVDVLGAHTPADTFGSVPWPGASRILRARG